METNVAVIGAGNVGATTALMLAERRLANVIMVDVVEGMPQGKALDMGQTGPLHGYAGQVRGSNDYGDIAGADIVVVTAGLPRKPGMSRSDLVATNAGIMKEVADHIRRQAPEAIVIVVTNPLDVMAWVAMRVTGFGADRVIGMAGVLDSTRMRTFLAEELGVHPADVTAMVLGGHGDSMVPCLSMASVSGIPVRQLVAPERLEAIVERTRKGGGEVVSLLKTGSAYHAPAASAVQMVEAILHDSKRVLPCSVYLEGAYGIEGTFAGVPVRLGRAGVEHVYEIELTEVELEDLRGSAAQVRRETEALAEQGEV